MSYRKRGAHKKLPDTTDVRAIELAERPSNRHHRRAGMHGGQGFAPLDLVRLSVAGPRRRSTDPAPWMTGTGCGPKGRAVVAREFEAAHRAASDVERDQ